MRKSEQTRPYAPDFVSAETLAYRLDCSVRSIHDYAKTGIIPRPVTVGNLVRWEWSAVVHHIARQNGLAGGQPHDSVDRDEYSADIKKALQSTQKAANDSAA